MIKTKPIQLSDKDARRFWSHVALPDANGCMLWMKSTATRGYGGMDIQGLTYRVHRLALWLAEGPPPPGKTDAAHSCRNRHCVAPAHLRWATRTENNGDKIADGTSAHGQRSPRAKLTDAQVQEIRQRYARTRVTQKELGAEFGIAPQAVSAIVLRQTWSHLPESAATCPPEIHHDQVSLAQVLDVVQEIREASITSAEQEAVRRCERSLMVLPTYARCES